RGRRPTRSSRRWASRTSATSGCWSTSSRFSLHTGCVPERPEMQALAERLEAAVGGMIFTGYEPIQFSALKTFSPAPEELIGKKVKSLGRRGKYVLIDFGGPRISFHLSPGGRVHVQDPPK